MKMGDEWAEAMNEFTEAVYAAKEAGITEDEAVQEVRDRYEDE